MAEVYKDRDGNLIYPNLVRSGEGTSPYYLLRRNSITGNMDQVYSSSDLHKVQKAWERESFLSFTAHLEIWSARLEGFGAGVYGND